MALSQSAVDLWRRSSPFRIASIGAVVVTVMVMLSGRGSAPPGSPPNNSGNAVSAKAPQQTPPASAGSNLPAYCSASGNSLQPALVVNSGNQAPANVSAVGGPATTGMSVDTQSRFRQFITRVDAAAREPRLGEKCSRMQDATQILQAQDYAFAACFADGEKKLVQAQQCSQDYQASENRFTRLLDAVAAVSADASAPQVDGLAQARKSMMPFDESRDRWSEISADLSSGDNAIATINASDARVAALQAAFSAYKANPGIAQLQSLASANSLQPIDITRLDTTGKDMLAQAQKASVTLQESDSRLSDVSSALSLLHSGADNARDALIAGVSALTPFDDSRASVAQREAISSAKAEASSFAMDDLLSVVKTFDHATATPAQFDNLRNLREVVLRYGGIAEPTIEQQSGLDAASKATAVLEQSDQRLATVNTVAATVRTTGPATQGSLVIEAFDAITTFDQARMDDQAVGDYKELSVAKEVVLATRKRALTRSVPLYISADSATPVSAMAVEALRDSLRSEGYHIVSAEEESAVAFEMSVGELNVKRAKIAGVKVTTADISMTLSGQWTLAGEALPIQIADGVGRGRQYQQQAIDEAIETLSGLIIEMTEDTQ